MHPEDFEASPAGRCIRTPRGYWAFVPHPLPPSLELNWSLVRLLSEADRALSELAGAGRLLPNPHLLIGPYMRREAVLSSRIENTQAGMGDLFFFEADETEPPKAPDVREVANYVQALDYGLTRLQELPISTRTEAARPHGVFRRQRHMARVDNRPTELGKSFSRPLSRDRKEPGHQGRTGCAGQQHSAQPRLIDRAAPKTSGLVERIAQIPDAEEAILKGS